MLDTLLIAFALSMDCFAVSVVCGVIIRRFETPLALRMGLLFGLFHILMPLVGWLLTKQFHGYIEAVDHWVAFAMLAIIGGKMVADSFKEEEDASSLHPRKLKTQLLLAVATTIDALAIGISYACTGYSEVSQLYTPLLLIGLVSMGMSLLGFWIGSQFGDTVNRKLRPELLGGVILIGIGLKVLLEHLLD